MYRILLVSFLVFLAFGCGTDSEDVVKIDNFRHDGEFLFWDALEGAQYYELHIDEATYLTHMNAFDLRNIESGQRAARVRARLDGRYSAWTPVMNFTLQRPFEHPKHPRIEEDAFVWDGVEDALHYLVDVNGDETQVETTTFPLEGLDEGAVYTLRVRAVFDDGVSAYGQSVYHLTLAISETVETSFNVLSVRALVVDLEAEAIEGLLLEGHDKVSETRFDYDGERLRLDHRLFQGRDEEDDVVFDFILEGMRHRIVVELFAEEKPYMISDNSLTYVSEQDIVLTFELFGGTFENLSGNTITEDEWSESDGVLTIDYGFVERILDDNPERETIILGYHLKHGDFIVVGYIFIHIDHDE